MYPAVYRNYFKIPCFKGGCPLLNTAVEADDTHPLLKAKAAQSILFLKTAVENQIKRGIERKEIKATTNATEVAVVIIAMIEGAVMQAKVTEQTTNLKIAMDYLEKMILGLKK